MSEVSDIEVSIWQAYRDQGVVVWGIGSPDPGRETEEQLAAYRDQYGITFPILLDEGGVVIDQYSQDLFEVSPYPQDWVIGVDGKVAYVNTAYEIDEITAVIEAELAR